MICSRTKGSPYLLQLDEVAESLEKKAKAFKKAAAIICSQLPHQQGIWMRSIDCLLGSDVIELVEDINHHCKMGRKRDTMWAEGKSKEEKRRLKNTMGYMNPIPRLT